MRDAPRRDSAAPFAFAAALLAVAAALFVLGSCASGPGKTAPGAAASPPPAAAPAAAPEAKSPAPIADAAKPASVAAPAKRASVAAPVEVSFPYRRAPRLPLIVASLHEPLPPKPKVAAPVAAAAPAPLQAPTAAPVAPSAEAPKAAAPQGGADKKAEPKVAAAPAAKDKKAAAKPPPKAAAKKEQKPVAVEPKNAASTDSLAVVSDPVSEKKAIVGRKVSAVEGTRFELPFDGTGWTYLGEQSNKEGISYDSRRFEDTSLVFILNPVKSGDYVLRFQRQDSLRGLSYEELVGVSVAPKPTAAPANATAAVATANAAPANAAPANALVSAAPSALPAKPAVAPAGASAVPSGSATAPVGAPAIPPGAAPTAALPASAFDPATLSTPEAALSFARGELSADRVQSAVAALDRFLALAPGGSDEAYILYARALEKTGPQKDIKRAYAFYKKLRDEYPESAFWDEAAARCSYIERYYFDIR